MADVIQTITADTLVDDGIEETDFFGEVILDTPVTEDLEGNITTEQPTPVAPTLSSATDLKKGDVVRLVWSGGGPFYNVYFKKTADATFIKANFTRLPSSQTQYDIGGLQRDTLYDFQVSAVNGAGDEVF